MKNMLLRIEREIGGEKRIIKFEKLGMLGKI